MDLFVTGTGTDVGKTVLSALLVAALEAGYWKPVQTGRLGGRSATDRETVMRWAAIDSGDAPPESWIFDPPVSPHLAAREAGTTIDLDAIERPAFSGRLVIEGAGGALVPVNDDNLMIDLMDRLEARIVVAARTSLGTINHTLLTIEAIRRRGLDLLGVVLIGEESRSNREAIEHYGRVAVVGWVPPLDPIDRSTLRSTYESHFDHSRFREAAAATSP